jgi:carboxylesterase
MRAMLRVGCFSALFILLVIIVIAFGPQYALNKSANPKPIADYVQAVHQIDLLRAAEQDTVNPLCQTQLLTHGQKTPRVIVFVHGNTSCPLQFSALAKLFYAQGDNVLLGRLPHHGLTNRLTDDLQNLTAEELVAFVDTIVDAAHGLGEQVTLAGISAGGVIVSWGAQYRSDVQQAVIMSPAFGFSAVPTIATKPAMNVALVLPNSFAWWDENLKEQGSPPHVYPRYSTHALAQYLRLGFAVQDAARQRKPAAQSIVVITNASDPSVNNALTADLVKQWRAHGGAIRTFEFDAGLGLGHDFVDPTLPGQPIDIVYPRLVQLVGE